MLGEGEREQHMELVMPGRVKGEGDRHSPNECSAEKDPQEHKYMQILHNTAKMDLSNIRKGQEDADEISPEVRG